MTGRERLLAALRGEVPDRVPVWAWGIHPWLGEVDPSIQPVADSYLDRGDLLCWWGGGIGTFGSAAHVPVEVKTWPSRLPDYDERVTTWHTPAGDLTQVMYVSHHGRPGYVRKYPLETFEDVRRMLSVPYEPWQPDCGSFFERDAELGDRGLMLANTGVDPMYALNHLCGSETFAIWSIEQRAMVDELIDVFLQRQLDHLRRLLAQGVGPAFGYVGPELCIPPLQSPRDFERWVVEPDRRIADAVHEAGGVLLAHCHGDMRPVLEGFVRMKADALHPIEPPPHGMTMAEAKRRVGGDLCIVGNIQHHDIESMEPRRFREVVAETVRAGMPGGRFILSPTATPFGWPTMTDRARENWTAMLDVALEVGRY